MKRETRGRKNTGKPHRPIGDTKRKIFEESVHLFSERGIEAVSMRAIAKAVGIKPSSLYNHYESKEQLVLDMYAFYIDNVKDITAYQSDLVRLAETMDATVVLSNFVIYYPSPHEALLTKIVQIAIARMRSDRHARALIKHAFIDNFAVLRKVLIKLRELDKIKPIDVENFLDIYRHLCFSATYTMNMEGIETGHQNWAQMNRLLFSLILEQEPPRIRNRDGGTDI